MAELMFRKGLLAALPAAYTEGAISITTDVPGMYLDLADKRIRIGDFVAVAELASLVENAEKYGYSTNTLFYAEKENVLCKIVEKDGNKVFQQINSTDELEQAINTRLTAVEGSITTLNGGADVAGSVAAAVKAEKDRAEGIEANLQSQIDAITGTGEDGDATTIAGLNAKIAEVSTNLQSEITRSTGADSTHDTKITAIEGDIDSLEGDIDSLEGRMATAEGAIQTLNGDVNTAGSVDKKVADAVSAAKSELTTTINGVSDKANTNATNITALQGTVGGHTTKIGEHDTAITGLTEHMTTAEGKITTAEGKLTTLTGGPEVAGSVAEAKKAGTDAAAAAATAKSVADAAQGTADEAKTAAATADGKAVAAQETADAAVDAVEALETYVGTIPKGEDGQPVASDVIAYINKKTEGIATDTALGELQAKVTAAEGAIAAETKAREEADTKHTQDIAKNAQDIATNAGAIATNAENIGKNTQAIADEASARAAAITAEQGARDAAIKVETDRATAAEEQIRKDFAAADAATLKSAKDYVDKHLAAADAMTFCGTTVITDLPLTDVKAGDTYVVASEYNDTEANVRYHAGDLMIAKEDQGEEAVYAGGWAHVKTGYDSVHESTLANDGTSIKLTSHVDENLGSVAIATGNTAATLAADAKSNLVVSSVEGTIYVDMVWGEF